tara:strand:+ start:40954 stop:42186 length:1233 start_codon:yes stop_codon:yes gene_type:complete
MSTNANSNLSDMLREYAKHSIITDKFSKNNFVWDNFEIDPNWKNGAEYQIPWELAEASDFEMGGLVDEDDIGEGLYKKAKLYDQPELWGALIFEEKDLERYGDLKQSFLKVLPGKIDKFTRRMKSLTNCVIMRGGSISEATADGTAGGILKVAKPQYFTIGQRVEIQADSETTLTAYVVAIDINARTLHIQDARSSGSDVDLSLYTVAKGTEVYIPGAETENFTTLMDYLLPSTLGGKDTIHGVAKSTAPLLQPQLIDGSSLTSSTVVEKLIDYYYDIGELGKAENGKMIVPPHVFKAFAKKLETSKRATIMDRKATAGGTALSIVGPYGNMLIESNNDMKSSNIFFLDTSDFCVAGDKFFDRKRHQNNEEFYMIRKKTGFRYIVDTCFRGQFIAKRLSASGCIHSVPTL